MATAGFQFDPQFDRSQPPKARHGSGGGRGGGWSTSRGDAFDDGVRAGRERAERHNLLERAGSELDYEEAGDVIVAPLNTAADVLEREDYSRRFVELFAEMMTVASLSRLAFRDPELDEAAVTDYVSHSSRFFNSWRHA